MHGYHMLLIDKERYNVTYIGRHMYNTIYFSLGVPQQLFVCVCVCVSLFLHQITVQSPEYSVKSAANCLGVC